MKLRLESDTLRFRLSPAELDRLLASGSLTASTPLPGGAFRYAVELTDGDDWAFTGDAHHIVLRLPKLDVLGHKAELPSKTGLLRTLRVNGGVLDVCFEIDAKRPRTHRTGKPAAPDQD
ncbi:MAG: DUF7009 family protein [Gammaproteobacteria bacterium]